MSEYNLNKDNLIDAFSIGKEAMLAAAEEIQRLNAENKYLRELLREGPYKCHKCGAEMILAVESFRLKVEEDEQ